MTKRATALKTSPIKLSSPRGGLYKTANDRNIPRLAPDHSLTKVDSVYFTLVTLSTVGYGDITPVTQGCRSLVSVQLAAEIVLIVVILGLLVARIAAKLR